MKTFDDAVGRYLEVVGEGATQPNRNMSRMDKTGRWILYNVTGFLAYVTPDGRVLDARFQSVGGPG
jgi:hypothetical protein